MTTVTVFQDQAGGRAGRRPLLPSDHDIIETGRTRRRFPPGIVPGTTRSTPTVRPLPCRLTAEQSFRLYLRHTPSLEHLNHLADAHLRGAKHREPPRQPETFPS